MTTSTRSLIATIAGFSALGFVFLALVYWVVLANPPMRFDNIDTTMKVLLVAAIISFTVYIVAAPESVGTSVGKRSTRLTLNAIVGALIAIAIAVVLNILAESTVTARADWTAGQDFALSEQSIKVIRDYEQRGKDVTAYAFFVPQLSGGEVMRQAEDLFKEYRSYTSKIRYEIVDLERDPRRALQYNVTRSGVVVFDDGTKQITANSISQKEFTSALVKLMSSDTRTVAFLSGHGEADVNSFERSDFAYSIARESLVQDNFNVITWRLVSTATATQPTTSTGGTVVAPNIPLDRVDVLVIAGPQEPLTDSEIREVQQYLDAGGSALVLSDPAQSPEAIESLRKLVSKYGVEPVRGLLIDLERQTQDPASVLVTQYPPHEITEGISRRSEGTYFQLSQAIRVLTDTAGFNVAPLVQSSSQPGASWLETTSLQVLQFDQGQDLPGPINIGVVVSPQEGVTTTNSTRLAVFGDMTFASNASLGDAISDYNVDLFSNSVSWLAGARELVSIREKDPSVARRITLDQGQKNLMFMAAVLGLPLFVVLAGGIVWWRRK